MKNKSPLTVIIASLLLFLIIFNVGSVLWNQKEKYLSNDFWERYPALKTTYEESQYVNKNPKGWIPDEPVNTYAGAAYIKGLSPILIAPDTPPLGRYLIGVSALLFNNEHIIILISFGIILLFLYLIARLLFSSIITVLASLALITSEHLIISQLIYTPLLDILQLMFLLISFYCFMRGFTTKKHLFSFVLANIALGCFISTKFFATGITVVAAYYTVLLLHKDKKRLVALTVTMPLSVLVLLATYSKVLIDNFDVRAFLGVQKWVFLYHKSQLMHPFSIWPLILFNQWYTWWGDNPVISDPQWRITWPILLIGSLLTIGFYLMKKIHHKREIEALMAWAVFYILFFSFGQVTSRYLVIYFPILYLVLLYGCEQLAFGFLHHTRKDQYAHRNR